MGTHFFANKAHGDSFHPSQLNMEARAIGAPSYAGKIAGGRAAKDLGAASALYKAGALKPAAKTAASAAPGPKV